MVKPYICIHGCQDTHTTKSTCSLTSSVSSSSSDESIVGTPTKRTVDIYCHNKHWGCQWDGSLDAIFTDIVNDCQFVEVTCGLCHCCVPYCMLKGHHDSNCTKLPISLLVRITT